MSTDVTLISWQGLVDVFQAELELLRLQKV